MLCLHLSVCFWDVLSEIFDALYHASYIFPDDTDKTVTPTAHANANTWSAWVEIVDNNALAFSSVFADCGGHITVIQQEELSDENTIYMLQKSFHPISS